MNQGFTDFEGPGDGVTCTAANLNATNRGILTGTWSVDGTGAAMKFATAAARGLLFHGGPLADDSIILPDAGTLGVEYDTDSGTSYITRHIAGVGNTVDGDEFSWGCFFFSDLPNNDASNLDPLTVYSLGGVNFANAKYLQSPGGNRCFQLEVGSGGASNGGGNSSVEVAASTWYWVAIIYRVTGNHELRIYNLAGELVGAIVETSSGLGGRASYVAIGQASSNTPTAGRVCRFDSFLFDLAGTWPLLPGSTGDFLRLNQTANASAVTELVRRAAVTNGVAGTLADAIIQHSGPYPSHPDTEFVYAKHGTPQKHVYVFEGTLTLAQAQAARDDL